MLAISLDDLTHVTGGITKAPSGTRNQRYKEMCLTPDPATARKQYEWLKEHQIPDSSEAPGVKRRVVEGIGNLCGWK